MVDSIRFGTDGWRGIISRDFTFGNLEIVARRIARWIKNKDGGVCVGYDNRFLSPEYASFTAAVISKEGVSVDLSSRPVPAPCVSHRVKKSGAAVVGVMITASHNGPEYNGFKIKEKYGGSASQQTTSEISSGLENNSPSCGIIEFKGKRNDWTEAYLDEMRRILPPGDFSVACDFMYGTGSPFFEQLLAEKGYNVIPLHNWRDPLFGGRSPEPKPQSLKELSRSVIEKGAEIGFAFDGDSDRIAAVDENGKYLSPQVILAVLGEDILSRGIKGKIIMSVAGSYLIERIASAYNTEVEIVPIGFKNMCPHLLKGDAVLAGEESGGIGFGDYLPERDAIYAASRILEMCRRRGKTIGEIWKEVKGKYGNSAYLRKDIKVTPGISPLVIIERIKKSVQNGRFPFKVKSTLALDGLRIIMENGRWLLIRPSGTEPVVRIYAESEQMEDTEILLEEGEKAVLGKQ